MMHLNRSLLIVGIFCCALVATRAHVAAKTEYCPADVEMVPIASASSPKSAATTDYVMTLEAASPRTVSGTVSVFASGKWYSVAFSNAVLAPFDERFTDSLGSFTRTDYLSNDEVVHFPEPVTLTYAYVSSAQSPDEAVYGWGGKGRIVCPNGAGPFSTLGIHARHAGDRLTLLNPRPLPQEMGIGFGPVAKPMAAPGTTDCDDAFGAPNVLKAREPVPPSPLSYTMALSIVDVAVSATGSVDDAWIWGESGNSESDDAARLAAQASTYAPARLLCKNAPGIYRFYVEVNKS